MSELLLEDFDGLYWYASPRHRQRLCANLDCCWPVELVRRRSGWWWEHDEDPGALVQAGPFDAWQDAARAAVASGHVHLSTAERSTLNPQPRPAAPGATLNLDPTSRVSVHDFGPACTVPARDVSGAPEGAPSSRQGPGC